MTDHSELKRLAEAATPGRNFDRLLTAGGGLKYECTGDDRSLVLKVDHKNDEWGFVGDNGAADEEFFLACTPVAVLALIAEIEGLRAQHGRDSAELRNLCQARDDARKERDKLKAENEALRKDAERYRFLKSRTQQADIELAVCLHDKRTQATVFLDGEYVDSQTDIAMNQGVKS